MKDFFEMIYGEGVGLACLTRNDVQGAPTLDKFFSYPEELDEMVTYSERYSKQDVYFTPSLWKDRYRRKALSSWLSCAFSDSDTVDLNTLRIEPSITVTTSPGRTHVYWLLSDEHGPDEVEALNRGISAAHDKKTTGMDDGHARNKLLRVPGTSNLKYDEPYEVTYNVSGAIYSYAELAKSYPPVKGGSISFRPMGTLPTRIEAMNALKSYKVVEDVIDQRFEKRFKGSEALYFAQQELFRQGATDEVAFVLLSGKPIDKFTRDGKPNAEQLLWEDIQRARAKQVPADEQEEVTPYEMVLGAKSYDFLTRAEHESLEPTFIDEFVSWSSARTKGSKEFMVASAFSTLSTVFSDFGHAEPSWGRLPLNLWFMVLGRTTLDRKSTIKNHMLEVLNALSDDEIYNYEIGSDFTTEAITGMALENPNRSGVIVRDEIQSWLRELEAKSFMSGTKGTLTDIFDGRVNGKLRATGDNKRKKSVQFSLSLYAMGIQEQVADTLLADDFGSGFLTRFTWVEPLSDEAEIDFNDDGFTQRSGNAVKAGDHAFRKLVDDLRDSRDHYASFIETADKTEAILCEPDAWERLGKFRTEMLLQARAIGADVVMAPAERLSITILKCATLLAMAEAKDTVHLKHILSAIYYANGWFANMLKMAERISESGWKKNQDDVLKAIILAGSSIDSKKLYAKFSGKQKPRDHQEILKALIESGHIVERAEGSGKYSYQIAGNSVGK